MSTLRIEGAAPLVGEVAVPPDKSITHRGLLLGALAEGTTEVRATQVGEDNRSTARVLQGLGVRIDSDAQGFRVDGRGPRSLVPPRGPLDCGNSGTTIRLLAGVLAGAGVAAELGGDASLSRRPMGRVCRPLRELGARIGGRREGERELPPLRIEGAGFAGGAMRLPVASAQVKSALLLAGVASGQAVEVSEPTLSRDHTERLLRAMGADLDEGRQGEEHRVQLAAGARLRGCEVVVPGDFSSAAFFLAAGLLVPGSRLVLRDVGLNPTRTGMLEILEELGAGVRVGEWREVAGEPVGRLTVEPRNLRATRPGEVPLGIAGPVIPRLIDELVVLAALCAQADGVTEIAEAAELRVKESDRIAETVRLLAAFGIAAEARPDGLRLRGPQPLHAATFDVSADHRIALTAAVLGLAAPGTSVLSGFEVAAVSYPGFVADLQALGARLRVDGA